MACPSCTHRLRLPDEAVGKRLRCPRCKHVFTATSPEALEVTEPELIEDEPETPRRRRQPEEDAPPVRKRRPQENIQTEPVAGRKVRDEAPKEEDAAPTRPAEEVKKKKRKKKRRPDVAKKEGMSSGTLWWIFGGGGVLLVMLGFAAMAVFADNIVVKFFAIYLLIAMPIYTAMFFLAMYISSVVFGALEIGEIHVAVVKAFILTLFVTMVSWISFGGFLTLAVMLVGIIVLFRLDPWEARMLLFTNWLLNYGVRFAMLAIVMSWMSHASDRFDKGLSVPDQKWQQGDDGGLQVDPGGDRGPAAQDVWDEDVVKQRGGGVQFDQARPDEEIVIAISFRGARVTDADLAHMKDFPRLLRLDLTDTAITDVGLAQLQACQGLKELTLTGTKVTDAGVQQLQNALPKLKIIR
jgi:hypothetical protein